MAGWRRRRNNVGATVFKHGERVWCPGASGAPAGMIEELVAAPGAQILTSFLPGVNDLPKNWAPDVSVAGPFAFPGTGYRHLPLSYAGLARHLDSGSAIDTAVVQLSPPNRDGKCTLGPMVEFSAIALRRAARRVGVINYAVPTFVTAPEMALSDFDDRIEVTAPLPAYGAGLPDFAAAAVAALIAPYIVDGAALQIGLGKIPTLLMEQLADRRRLRLHSGMLSDSVMALADSGALDAQWRHATTVFLGSAELYAWASSQHVIHLLGCEDIHDSVRLSRIEGLMAINSALEVDLFGQCNLEVARGRQVSGGGGASDFARAGRLSRSGLSIIALPATFGDRGGSRIVAALGSDSLVTLGRTDVDLVVTEHGVADLRGLDVAQRAAAITAVAHPSVRGDLQDAWKEMAARFGFRRTQ